MLHEHPLELARLEGGAPPDAGTRHGAAPAHGAEARSGLTSSAQAIFHTLVAALVVEALVRSGSARPRQRMALRLVALG